MSDLNGFTVVAQTGGRWYSEQEYPGAQSWLGRVPATATLRCPCGTEVEVSEDYPTGDCPACGRAVDASTLLPKPEEPTDFDPWGGREAPPWTY
jgi:hypothetical protein